MGPQTTQNRPRGWWDMSRLLGNYFPCREISPRFSNFGAPNLVGYGPNLDFFLGMSRWDPRLLKTAHAVGGTCLVYLEIISLVEKSRRDFPTLVHHNLVGYGPNLDFFLGVSRWDPRLLKTG